MMNGLQPEAVYIVISGLGSFISGFIGVRVGMVRIEERSIALTARVDRIEKRIDENDKSLHDWLHDEYAPQITELWGEIRTLKAIVERLERRRDP